MLTELVGSCASETLDAYVRGLRGVFGDGLAGVYLYGSVALGDYDPAVSDVDVAVLHRSDLSREQRRALARLHEHFGSRYAASARFDVSFVPLRLVGTYGENNLPYYREGRFHPVGGGDINPVMWNTLRESGMILSGAPAAEFVAPVSGEELAETMRRNLAFLSRRMPAYVRSGTRDQVFGVLCLCRSLHTLRTGEIFGKASAARWALGEVDLRWRSLIERALTRYQGDDLSGSDPLLEKKAEAFALHLRKATERSYVPWPPRSGIGKVT